MVPRHQPLPAELRSLLPATLHGLCEQRRYERGALLFETGRRPGSMFFISDGEVTLQRIGEDGEIVVLQRTRHGLVGEARRVCSRIATTATRSLLPTRTSSAFRGRPC